MPRSGKAARERSDRIYEIQLSAGIGVPSGQACLRQIRCRCAGRKENTVSMYELIQLSQRSCYIQSLAKIGLLLDINGIAAGFRPAAIPFCRAGPTPDPPPPRTRLRSRTRPQSPRCRSGADGRPSETPSPPSGWRGRRPRPPEFWGWRGSCQRCG